MLPEVNRPQAGSMDGSPLRFKLHLIINNLGEIIDFTFTAANVADNDKNLLTRMLGDLKGKLFGDKGYLTKLWEQFYENGLQIMTKIRKNMKNRLMPYFDRLWLMKRPVIESVNDILTTVFDLQHSRHRKAINAFVHMIATVIAYQFYPDKPAVKIPFLMA
ncbi:MAG: hypothetical protein OHK0038_17320 [Flammeovirgaceae bacterium]